MSAESLLGLDGERFLLAFANGLPNLPTAFDAHREDG
jgi:hypothetical protein